MTTIFNAITGLHMTTQDYIEIIFALVSAVNIYMHLNVKLAVKDLELAITKRFADYVSKTEANLYLVSPRRPYQREKVNEHSS